MKRKYVADRNPAMVPRIIDHKSQWSDWHTEISLVTEIPSGIMVSFENIVWGKGLHSYLEDHRNNWNSYLKKVFVTEHHVGWLLYKKIDFILRLRLCDAQQSGICLFNWYTAVWVGKWPFSLRGVRLHEKPLRISTTKKSAYIINKTLYGE